MGKMWKRSNETYICSRSHEREYRYDMRLRLTCCIYVSLSHRYSLHHVWGSIVSHTVQVSFYLGNNFLAFLTFYDYDLYKQNI